MAELYGGKKNIPYDHKTVSNYTATLCEERFKDIPMLLNYFEELKEKDLRFFYKYSHYKKTHPKAIDTLQRYKYVLSIFMVDTHIFVAE
jgi:hypothetical protein